MAARKKEFTLNTDELMEAMDLYQQATGYTATKIINRKGAVICNRASKEVPKAIQKSINVHKPKKKGATYESRLFYAIATKYKGGKKGAGIKAKAEELRKGRLRAVQFCRALFLTMAKEFGADLKKVFKVEGVTVSPATFSKQFATLQSNELDASLRDDILIPAFERAARKEAEGTVKHAQKLLAKDAAKYSGRK